MDPSCVLLLRTPEPMTRDTLGFASSWTRFHITLGYSARRGKILCQLEWTSIIPGVSLESNQNRWAPGPENRRLYLASPYRCLLEHPLPVGTNYFGHFLIHSPVASIPRLLNVTSYQSKVSRAPSEVGGCVGLSLAPSPPFSVLFTCALQHSSSPSGDDSTQKQTLVTFLFYLVYLDTCDYIVFPHPPTSIARWRATCMAAEMFILPLSELPVVFRENGTKEDEPVATCNAPPAVGGQAVCCSPRRPPCHVMGAYLAGGCDQNTRQYTILVIVEQLAQVATPQCRYLCGRFHCSRSGPWVLFLHSGCYVIIRKLSACSGFGVYLAADDGQTLSASKAHPLGVPAAGPFVRGP